MRWPGIRRPNGSRPPVGPVQDLVPPFELLPDGQLRARGWTWRLFRLEPEPTAPIAPEPAQLRQALVDPLPLGMRLRLWRAVRFDASGREDYLQALMGAGASRSPWGFAYLKFLEEEPLSIRPAIYGGIGWMGEREAEAENYLRVAQDALGGLAVLHRCSPAEILQFLGVLARLEVIR